MSKIEDGALLRIRQSPGYRTAVWLMRAGILVLLPMVGWMPLSLLGLAPLPSDTVFLAAWTVASLAIVPAWVLFHRSGFPIWEMKLSFDNPILRDVFWRRPR